MRRTILIVLLVLGLAACTTSTTPTEQAVTDHTNYYRAQVGAPQMGVSQNLAREADEWAMHLVNDLGGALVHSNLNDTLNRWPVFNTCGENLYRGPIDPKTIVDAWRNSPGHDANLRNPAFTQMGVGISGNVVVARYCG